MALPTYSTGTASVAVGGTVVTGVGVAWTGINAKQGDFISIGGAAEVLITEVTDATHLKIAPWPGTVKTSVTYVIYQNYVGRVVGVAAAEDVGEMLEKLHTDALPFIVGSGETVPNPSYGDDGQFAYSPTTGQWWVKSGGVWVQTVPPANAGAVLYSAQSLTTAQQEQARKNIYAAPMDALSYSGMQINGSMEISQEWGTAGVGFTGIAAKYVLDGWIGNCNMGTAACTAIQQPITTEVPGFKSCLQFIVSTAKASFSGTEYFRFTTPIEGYRFLRAKWGTASATLVTVSFWARASVAGTYRLLIANFDASSVSAWVTFSLTAGATFQWISVTMPAITTGTWKGDNSLGAMLIIEATSSSTPNVFTTVGNYFSITGVVVLPGSEAPTAARSYLIMRPYDQELATCKRYFQKVEATLRFAATTTGQFMEMNAQWLVESRGYPAVTVGSGALQNVAPTYPQVFGINPIACRFVIQSIAAGDTYALQTPLTVNARL